MLLLYLKGKRTNQLLNERGPALSADIETQGVRNMRQRMVVLFSMICAVVAANGEARDACALWNGPPTIVAPLPQPMQLTPQMPNPQNNQVLLKDLPGSAPQAVTDKNQGNSGAASGSNNAKAESQSATPSRPEPPPAEQPVSPPVEKPVPLPVEKTEPATSPSKMPWLLVAGGVAVAFVLGRRTK